MMIQFSHAYGEFHMAGHENQPPQAQSNRGKTKMITLDAYLHFFSPCLRWPNAGIQSSIRDLMICGELKSVERE
jgi:hypothetical protein